MRSTLYQGKAGSSSASAEGGIIVSVTRDSTLWTNGPQGATGSSSSMVGAGGIGRMQYFPSVGEALAYLEAILPPYQGGDTLALPPIGSSANVTAAKELIAERSNRPSPTTQGLMKGTVPLPTLTAKAATIIVSSGTYVETMPLLFSRPYIEIKAESDALPTIQTTDGCSVVVSGHVHFSGLRFLSPDTLTPAVLVLGKDPIFTGCTIHLMRVDNTACPSVVDCSFGVSTRPNGLVIAGNASGEFRDCTFSSCFLYGAHIESDRAPSFQNCRFNMSGRGAVVICGPKSSPRFVSCIVQDSTQPNVILDPLTLQAPGDKARMKVGTACDRAGIIIANGASPTIEQCTIFSCEGHGVACYPSGYVAYRIVSTDSYLFSAAGGDGNHLSASSGPNRGSRRLGAFSLPTNASGLSRHVIGGVSTGTSSTLQLPSIHRAANAPMSNRSSRASSFNSASAALITAANPPPPTTKRRHPSTSTTSIAQPINTVNSTSPSPQTLSSASASSTIIILKSTLRGNAGCGIMSVASASRVVSEQNIITDNRGGGIFVTDDSSYLSTFIHGGPSSISSEANNKNTERDSVNSNGRDGYNDDNDDDSAYVEDGDGIQYQLPHLNRRQRANSAATLLGGTKAMPSGVGHSGGNTTEWSAHGPPPPLSQFEQLIAFEARTIGDVYVSHTFGSLSLGPTAAPASSSASPPSPLDRALSPNMKKPADSGNRYPFPRPRGEETSSTATAAPSLLSIRPSSTAPFISKSDSLSTNYFFGIRTHGQWAVSTVTSAQIRHHTIGLAVGGEGTLKAYSIVLSGCTHGAAVEGRAMLVAEGCSLSDSDEGLSVTNFGSTDCTDCRFSGCRVGLAVRNHGRPRINRCVLTNNFIAAECSHAAEGSIVRAGFELSVFAHVLAGHRCRTVFSHCEFRKDGKVTSPTSDGIGGMMASVGGAGGKFPLSTTGSSQIPPYELRHAMELAAAVLHSGAMGRLALWAHTTASELTGPNKKKAHNSFSKASPQNYPSSEGDLQSLCMMPSLEEHSALLTSSTYPLSLRPAYVICHNNSRATFDKNTFIGGTIVLSGPPPTSVTTNGLSSSSSVPPTKATIPFVRVNSFADPTFSGNTFSCAPTHREGDDAIIIESNGLGVFTGNTVHGCDRSGIRVDQHAEPTVRGNTFADNFVAGVAVSKGGGGTFERNRIIGNHSYGVLVCSEENDEKVGGRIERRDDIRGGLSENDYTPIFGKEVISEFKAKRLLVVNASAERARQANTAAFAPPTMPTLVSLLAPYLRGGGAVVPAPPRFAANVICGSPIGVSSSSYSLTPERSVSVFTARGAKKTSVVDNNSSASNCESAITNQHDVHKTTGQNSGTSHLAPSLPPSNNAANRRVRDSLSHGGLFSRNIIFMCRIGVLLSNCCTAVVASCQIGPLNGLGVVVRGAEGSPTPEGESEGGGDRHFSSANASGCVHEAKSLLGSAFKTTTLNTPPSPSSLVFSSSSPMLIANTIEGNTSGGLVVHKGAHPVVFHNTFMGHVQRQHEHLSSAPRGDTEQRGDYVLSAVELADHPLIRTLGELVRCDPRAGGGLIDAARQQDFATKLEGSYTHVSSLRPIVDDRIVSGVGSLLRAIRGASAIVSTLAPEGEEGPHRWGNLGVTTTLARSCLDDEERYRSSVARFMSFSSSPASQASGKVGANAVGPDASSQTSRSVLSTSPFTPSRRAQQGATSPAISSDSPFSGVGAGKPFASTTASSAALYVDGVSLYMYHQQLQRSPTKRKTSSASPSAKSAETTANNKSSAVVTSNDEELETRWKDWYARRVTSCLALLRPSLSPAASEGRSGGNGISEARRSTTSTAATTSNTTAAAAGSFLNQQRSKGLASSSSSNPGNSSPSQFNRPTQTADAVVVAALTLFPFSGGYYSGNVVSFNSVGIRLGGYDTHQRQCTEGGRVDAETAMFDVDSANAISPPLFVNCVLRDNRCGTLVGPTFVSTGAISYLPAAVSFSRCTFSFNTIGVSAAAPTCAASDSTISSNSSPLSQIPTPVRLEQCSITHNGKAGILLTKIDDATSGGGGGGQQERSPKTYGHTITRTPSSSSSAASFPSPFSKKEKSPRASDSSLLGRTDALENTNATRTRAEPSAPLDVSHCIFHNNYGHHFWVRHRTVANSTTNRAHRRVSDDYSSMSSSPQSKISQEVCAEAELRCAQSFLKEAAVLAEDGGESKNVENIPEKGDADQLEDSVVKQSQQRDGVRSKEEEQEVSALVRGYLIRGCVFHGTTVSVALSEGRGDVDQGSSQFAQTSRSPARNKKRESFRLTPAESLRIGGTVNIESSLSCSTTLAHRQVIEKQQQEHQTKTLRSPLDVGMHDVSVPPSDPKYYAPCSSSGYSLGIHDVLAPLIFQRTLFIACSTSISGGESGVTSGLCAPSPIFVDCSFVGSAEAARASFACASRPRGRRTHNSSNTAAAIGSPSRSSYEHVVLVNPPMPHRLDDEAEEGGGRRSLSASPTPGATSTYYSALTGSPSPSPGRSQQHRASSFVRGGSRFGSEVGVHRDRDRQGSRGSLRRSSSAYVSGLRRSSSSAGRLGWEGDGSATNFFAASIKAAMGGNTEGQKSAAHSQQDRRLIASSDLYHPNTEDDVDFLAFIASVQLCLLPKINKKWARGQKVVREGERLNNGPYPPPDVSSRDYDSCTHLILERISEESLTVTDSRFSYLNSLTRSSSHSQGRSSSHQTAPKSTLQHSPCPPADNSDQINERLPTRKTLKGLARRVVGDRYALRYLLMSCGWHGSASDTLVPPKVSSSLHSSTIHSRTAIHYPLSSPKSMAVIAPTALAISGASRPSIINSTFSFFKRGVVVADSMPSFSHCGFTMCRESGVTILDNMFGIFMDCYWWRNVGCGVRVLGHMASFSSINKRILFELEEIRMSCTILPPLKNPLRHRQAHLDAHSTVDEKGDEQASCDETGAKEDKKEEDEKADEGDLRVLCRATVFHHHIAPSHFFSVPIDIASTLDRLHEVLFLSNHNLLPPFPSAGASEFGFVVGEDAVFGGGGANRANKSSSFSSPSPSPRRSVKRDAPSLFHVGIVGGGSAADDENVGVGTRGGGFKRSDSGGAFINNESSLILSSSALRRVSPRLSSSQLLLHNEREAKHHTTAHTTTNGNTNAIHRTASSSFSLSQTVNTDPRRVSRVNATDTNAGRRNKRLGKRRKTRTNSTTVKNKAVTKAEKADNAPTSGVEEAKTTNRSDLNHDNKKDEDSASLSSSPNSKSSSSSLSPRRSSSSPTDSSTDSSELPTDGGDENEAAWRQPINSRGLVSLFVSAADTYDLFLAHRHTVSNGKTPLQETVLAVTEILKERLYSPPTPEAVEEARAAVLSYSPLSLLSGRSATAVTTNSSTSISNSGNSTHRNTVTSSYTNTNSGARGGVRRDSSASATASSVGTELFGLAAGGGHMHPSSTPSIAAYLTSANPLRWSSAHLLLPPQASAFLEAPFYGTEADTAAKTESLRILRMAMPLSEGAGVGIFVGGGGVGMGQAVLSSHQPFFPVVAVLEGLHIFACDLCGIAICGTSDNENRAFLTKNISNNSHVGLVRTVYELTDLARCADAADDEEELNTPSYATLRKRKGSTEAASGALVVGLSSLTSYTRGPLLSSQYFSYRRACDRLGGGGNQEASEGVVGHGLNRSPRASISWRSGSQNDSDVKEGATESSLRARGGGGSSALAPHTLISDCAVYSCGGFGIVIREGVGTSVEMRRLRIAYNALAGISVEGRPAASSIVGGPPTPMPPPPLSSLGSPASPRSVRASSVMIFTANSNSNDDASPHTRKSVASNSIYGGGNNPQPPATRLSQQQHQPLQVTLNLSHVVGNSLGVVCRGDQLDISQCTIEHNTLSGVRSMDASNCSLTRCVVTANGSSGVDIYGSIATVPTITDCTLAANRLCGVLVSGGSRPSVRGCDVYGHTDLCGIMVRCGARPTIEGNTLFGNAAGVVSRLRAEPYCAENLITRNSIGVVIEWSGDGLWKRNTFTENFKTSVLSRTFGAGAFAQNMFIREPPCVVTSEGCGSFSYNTFRLPLGPCFSITRGGKPTVSNTRFDFISGGSGANGDDKASSRGRAQRYVAESEGLEQMLADAFNLPIHSKMASMLRERKAEAMREARELSRVAYAMMITKERKEEEKEQTGGDSENTHPARSSSGKVGATTKIDIKDDDGNKSVAHGNIVMDAARTSRSRGKERVSFADAKEPETQTDLTSAKTESGTSKKDGTGRRRRGAPLAMFVESSFPTSTSIEDDGSLGHSQSLPFPSKNGATNNSRRNRRESVAWEKDAMASLRGMLEEDEEGDGGHDGEKEEEGKKKLGEDVDGTKKMNTSESGCGDQKEQSRAKSTNFTETIAPDLAPFASPSTPYWPRFIPTLSPPLHFSQGGRGTVTRCIFTACSPCGIMIEGQTSTPTVEWCIFNGHGVEEEETNTPKTKNTGVSSSQRFARVGAQEGKATFGSFNTEQEGDRPHSSLLSSENNLSYDTDDGDAEDADSRYTVVGGTLGLLPVSTSLPLSTSQRSHLKPSHINTKPLPVLPSFQNASEFPYPANSVLSVNNSTNSTSAVLGTASRLPPRPAVLVRNGASPTLTICVFSENLVGLRTVQSSPTVRRCYFLNNKVAAVEAISSYLARDTTGVVQSSRGGASLMSDLLTSSPRPFDGLAFHTLTPAERSKSVLNASRSYMNNPFSSSLSVNMLLSTPSSTSARPSTSATATLSSFAPDISLCVFVKNDRYDVFLHPDSLVSITKSSFLRSGASSIYASTNSAPTVQECNFFECGAAVSSDADGSGSGRGGGSATIALNTMSKGAEVKKCKIYGGRVGLLLLSPKDSGVRVDACEVVRASSAGVACVCTAAEEEAERAYLWAVNKPKTDELAGAAKSRTKAAAARQQQQQDRMSLQQLGKGEEPSLLLISDPDGGQSDTTGLCLTLGNDNDTAVHVDDRSRGSPNASTSSSHLQRAENAGDSERRNTGDLGEVSIVGGPQQRMSLQPLHSASNTSASSVSPSASSTPPPAPRPPHTPATTDVPSSRASHHSVPPQRSRHIPGSTTMSTPQDIIAAYPSEALVRDTLIIHCSVGVVFEGDACMVTMLDSDVRQTSEGPGVVVRGEADPMLKNVAIRWGRREGVVFEHGAKGTLDNCTMQRNSVGVRMKGPSAGGVAGLSYLSTYEARSPKTAPIGLFTTDTTENGEGRGNPSTLLSSSDGVGVVVPVGRVLNANRRATTAHSDSAPLSSAPFSQLAADTLSLALASKSLPVPAKPLLYGISVCDSLSFGVVIEGNAHAQLVKSHLFDNSNGASVIAHADSRGVLAECHISVPSLSSSSSSGVGGGVGGEGGVGVGGSDLFLSFSESSDVFVAESNQFRKGVSPAHRGLTKKMRDEESSTISTTDDSICALQRQHFSEAIRDLFEWGNSFLGSMAAGHVAAASAMELLVSTGVAVVASSQNRPSEGGASLASIVSRGVAPPVGDNGHSSERQSKMSLTSSSLAILAPKPLLPPSPPIFTLYTCDVVEQTLRFLLERVDWSLRMGNTSLKRVKRHSDTNKSGAGNCSSASQVKNTINEEVRSDQPPENINPPSSSSSRDVPVVCTDSGADSSDSEVFPFLHEVFTCMLPAGDFSQLYASCIVSAPVAPSPIYSSLFWSDRYEKGDTLPMGTQAPNSSYGSASNGARLGANNTNTLVGLTSLASAPNACRASRREWAKARVIKALSLLQIEADRAYAFREHNGEDVGTQDGHNSTDGKHNRFAAVEDTSQLKLKREKALLVAIKRSIANALEAHRDYSLKPFLHYINYGGGPNATTLSPSTPQQRPSTLGNATSTTLVGGGSTRLRVSADGGAGSPTPEEIMSAAMGEAFLINPPYARSTQSAHTSETGGTPQRVSPKTLFLSQPQQQQQKAFTSTSWLSADLRIAERRLLLHIDEKRIAFFSKNASYFSSEDNAANSMFMPRVGTSTDGCSSNALAITKAPTRVLCGYSFESLLPKSDLSAKSVVSSPFTLSIPLLVGLATGAAHRGSDAGGVLPVISHELVPRACLAVRLSSRGVGNTYFKKLLFALAISPTDNSTTAATIRGSNGEDTGGGTKNESNVLQIPTKVSAVDTTSRRERAERVLAGLKTLGRPPVIVLGGDGFGSALDGNGRDRGNGRDSGWSALDGGATYGNNYSMIEVKAADTSPTEILSVPIPLLPKLPLASKFARPYPRARNQNLFSRDGGGGGGGSATGAVGGGGDEFVPIASSSAGELMAGPNTRGRSSGGGFGVLPTIMPSELAAQCLEPHSLVAGGGGGFSMMASSQRHGSSLSIAVGGGGVGGVAPNAVSRGYSETLKSQLIKLASETTPQFASQVLDAFAVTDRRAIERIHVSDLARFIERLCAIFKYVPRSQNKKSTNNEKVGGTGATGLPAWGGGVTLANGEGEKEKNNNDTHEGGEYDYLAAAGDAKLKALQDDEKANQIFGKLSPSFVAFRVGDAGAPSKDDEGNEDAALNGIEGDEYKNGGDLFALDESQQGSQSDVLSLYGSAASGSIIDGASARAGVLGGVGSPLQQLTLAPVAEWAARIAREVFDSSGIDVGGDGMGFAEFIEFVMRRKDTPVAPLLAAHFTWAPKQKSLSDSN